MDLKETHGVYTIVMRNKENRFNPDFVSRFNELLDEVEKTSAKALFVTGSDKYV